MRNGKTAISPSHWFLSQGYGPKTWRGGTGPGATSRRWMMPDLFLDLARGMEQSDASII